MFLVPQHVLNYSSMEMYGRVSRLLVEIHEKQRPMGVDLNGQLGSGSRTNPINGAVAQLVEHLPEEQGVAGSIPARTTK